MQMRLATMCLLTVCAVTQGCELVADFDRSKIPTGLDGSFEGGLPEEDAGDDDAGSEDAAVPVVTDAATDAATDSGTDAGQDASSGDDGGSDDAG